jgi:hypothetical protein
MYTKKLKRYKQTKEDFKEMKVQTEEELKSRLRPGCLNYKELPSLVSDHFDTYKQHDPFMDTVRHKKDTS